MSEIRTFRITMNVNKHISMNARYIAELTRTLETAGFYDITYSNNTAWLAVYVSAEMIENVMTAESDFIDYLVNVGYTVREIREV